MASEQRTGPSDKAVRAANRAIYGVEVPVLAGDAPYGTKAIEAASPVIVADIVEFLRRIGRDDPRTASMMDADECADAIEREFGSRE